MPAADRILIEIATAANLSGVKEAQAGMLGLGVTSMAMAAGFGIAFVAGKSMVEITEKHDEAMLGLAQAYKASNTDLSKYQVGIDQFIKKNHSFTSSQAEVITGFATLTRSGLSQTEVMRDMTMAVNLSALKHVSLAEAVDLVNKAEHGRFRGLVDLGIVTKAQIGADGELVVGTKDIAAAMKLFEQRTKDGTSAFTPLTKAQNELGNAWQDIATKDGPAFLAELTTITKYVADNMPTWGNWLGQLNDIGNQLGAIGHLSDIASRKTHDSIIQWYREHSGDRGQTLFPTHTPDTTTAPGFAEGGTVPGPMGAAMLAVVHGGETVTPAGGSGGPAQIHVHIDGIYAGDGPSLDILANKIALRLGYATGR